MRCTGYVLLLFGLLISTPIHAQDEPVEDTLDWRGYYPLAIGNAWEYDYHTSGGSDQTHYIHRAIVGDTVINDRSYFRQVERKILEWYETLGPPVEEYLRYDDDARTVVAWDADEARERLYYLYLCDLSAPFHSHPCSDLVFDGLKVTGGAQQIGQGPVRFYKRFSYRTFSGYYEFEHGRGPVSWTPAGFNSTREVYYTRIDSVEYGWSRMPPDAALPTESKEMPPALEMHIFSVFPLPSYGIVTATILPRAQGTIRSEVFDAAGRRVWTTTSAAGHLTGPVRLRIDGSSWSPGVYFLRSTDESGSRSVRSFVIVR